MNRLNKICKQLYEIGFNDGKNNINYFPKPYIEYAEKIKKEILNLECLKEEECSKGGKHEWETHPTDEGFTTYCSKCFINESWVLSNNQKIKEIIDEINKI